MDILFYTDTPGFGGAEKQMELLAKHLKNFGYTVHLACGHYSKLRSRKDELLNTYKTVHFLPTIHKHDPRHYSSLKKLIEKGPYKLVHLHLWNPGACRYAFSAVKRARLTDRIPLITTEHDPFRLTGLKNKIKRSCLAKTDQIIAISMDNYRQLSDYGDIAKNRLNIVHNGIEADRFFDIHDKAPLPVYKGKTVITCIAELHPRKGHKTLIKAFEPLSEEMPNLKLMLVGTGPIEKELKEQYGSNPNIHFLGWRDDIPQILNNSDLFILPSEREAFGLVVLEAMASNVAVIATNNGGTKDIILDGKTGLLIPPHDVEAMKEAMRTLLTNPGQKRDMEEAALRRVKEEFTAQKMAEKTAAVYRKALHVTHG